VALIARGLGSVLVLILGDGLVRHQLVADYLVHEDTFGIGAQIIVTLFIMSGLQVRSKLTLCSHRINDQCNFVVDRMSDDNHQSSHYIGRCSLRVNDVILQSIRDGNPSCG
jgi:hypothetical protein